MAQCARRAACITEKFAQEIVALSSRRQRQTIFPAFSVTPAAIAPGFFLAISNNHERKNLMEDCILEVTDEDENIIPRFIQLIVDRPRGAE